MTTAAAGVGGDREDAREALDRLRARVDGWKLGDDREVRAREAARRRLNSTRTVVGLIMINARLRVVSMAHGARGAIARGRGDGF